VPIPANNEIFEQINKDIDIGSKRIELYEGKGCKDCRSTGYLGRTGIYEILELTEAIRELVLERASSQQIKQKAIQQGMRTLYQQGLQKVVMGITTYLEVIRVTQQEELIQE
jgi:general secretion pathway protein E